ncbi:MAG: phage holin family protein [Thermoleophilia bacterium]|nr:phage holin family protein [Thermoleophilia bacterium]
MSERLGGLVLIWAGNVAALWVAARLLDGFGYSTTGALLLGAAVLAVVNWLVKPVLTIVAIPFIIATLGVAYLAICVLMLHLMAAIADGFHIDGWAGVWAAVIVGAVNTVLQPMLGVESSGKKRR